MAGVKSVDDRSLERSLHVLMVTSEWPTPEHPQAVPFIVRNAEFLRHAGVDVNIFHFRGAKKPANYLRAWKQLQDRLKSERYDLVHAQFGQSGLLALPKSLPLVVTFRGDDLQGIAGSDGRYTLAGRFLQLASQLVARVADEVIIVSEALARHLPHRSFHVIPSGLDLALFRPVPSAEARRQLGLPEQQRLILFAANPADPIKRYGLAQAAFDRLKGEYNIEMVVTKGVSQDKMPLYMNACDVLLLTSLHEGSPNVVKEALACDLPVVSTDVGDVRVRIGSIEGCAIVRDSPAELAAALCAILQRNKRIDGRRLVADLDENILTEQIIGVYNKALTQYRTELFRPADEVKNDLKI
jgi:teichuronic acid biosynthesis glycosyltransferase TuaC